MKGKITKRAIDAMKPGDRLTDNKVDGFVARCLPSGVVTYGLRYRVGGRQRWLALGLHGKVTPAAARKLAKKRNGEVADDRDPAAERKAKRAQAAAAASSTVNALLDAFLDRHVHKSLHTAREVERIFNRYVRERIGAASIYKLRRHHMVEMFDAIEDENGSVMADRVLAWVRKAFNWQAIRDDTFVPPIVRGMARTKSSERSRERTLTDDEIRAVWTALDRARVPRPYPALVRVLLLTGQRLEEVAGMRWEEVDGDGVWIIPAARRIKGGANTVPLTAATLQLLGVKRKKGFVFTTNGKASFSGFSKAKAALDAAIAAERKTAKRDALPHWILHDLRRTARSLMSRAGVSPDTAERVVGHVIPGVRGVYDRHTFLAEKRDALERLGGLVARALDPPVLPADSASEAENVPEVAMANVTHVASATLRA